MSFQSPALLVLLVVIPLLAMAYAGWERRRERAAGSFAAPHMRPNVAPVPPGWRRHLPVALLLVALAALLVGLARPARTRVVTVTGGTIVLVMDASKSMERTDILPSRLEVAVEAAEALVGQLPDGFRVGVVAFNRQVQTLSAPTRDREAIALALASLETRYRTVLGDGILGGLATVPEGGRSVELVVLSDGRDTASEVEPLAAAQEAAAIDVRIDTIALGSPEHPRGPDIATMRGVADVTGGRYFLAPTAGELEGIYRGIGRRASTATEEVEITQAFVGGGLLLMVAGAALSAAWFGRY